MMGIIHQCHVQVKVSLSGRPLLPSHRYTSSFGRHRRVCPSLFTRTFQPRKLRMCLQALPRNIIFKKEKENMDAVCTHMPQGREGRRKNAGFWCKKGKGSSYS